MYSSATWRDKKIVPIVWRLCSQMSKTLCYVAVYLLPIAVRVCVLSPPSSWADVGNVLLSVVPVLAVVPAAVLPRWIEDEEKEHVARHVLYATGFTVSVATSVRWHADEHTGWQSPLLAYCIVGAVTLWWFALAHVLENKGAFGSVLYTHHGDIVVLPLTLVAIATFAYDTPDRAFRYARSVVFYVPVIVGWATLHFIAFTDFARSRTTTHTHPGFSHLAYASVCVASMHLFLLEVRAAPVYFQLFPLVAAILAQTMRRPLDAPVLREGYWIGFTFVTFGACACAGAATGAFLDAVGKWTILLSVGGLIVASSVPRVAGDWWVAPAVGYATLGIAAFSNANVLTTVLVAGMLTLAFAFVDCVAPPTDPRVPVGLRQGVMSPLPTGTLLQIQLRDVAWPYAAALKYDDPELMTRLCGTPATGAPSDVAGVWWMKDGPFPMRLISLNGARWSEDGARATRTLASAVAFDATWGGWLTQLSCMGTHQTIARHGRWTETMNVWLWPLCLFPRRYWLYTVDEDCMIRLGIDKNGAERWRYTLLRVVRRANHRTSHWAEFAHRHGDQGCWVGGAVPCER